MIRNVVRLCRERLNFSQAAFAARLGVSIETYRTWDSGRRQPPASVVAQARQLAGGSVDEKPVPLAILAPIIGVHVRTLRHAARMGRLRVTYDTRTTFRHVRLRATRQDAETFLRMFYKRTYSRFAARNPVSWPQVPADYDAHIRLLRDRPVILATDRTPHRQSDRDALIPKTLKRSRSSESLPCSSLCTP